ncbi:MAG TPA: hypothetical protein VF432_21800 [Thermoanaerobaculia bacterium]
MSVPTITVSTELMKNYKQALVMSPEKQFEALQTATGSSLLFSIGTDGVFYGTAETSAHSTGWTQTDLSSAQIAASFPGQTGMSCKTFAAAQSAADGTIGLAMIVTDGTNDHLFLCLGNSNTDTSWMQSPAWTAYPFDDPPQSITIAGVFLSETAESMQYIVADILRDPASSEQLVSRYYIDTQSTPAWQPHDVAIDLEANSYTSCLGRQSFPDDAHQPTIDGLYTSGQVDGNPQLTFQPLYNVFDSSIPAPVARLSLPGGVVADTIASCRKQDLSTDLYASASGGLYYFASSNQQDGAVAVLVAQNAMFDGVRLMFAGQSNDISIVWGLNGSDEVFYTTCPIGQETASPSAWSYPLPICTEVDLLSPYINQVDQGNTFFVAAGDTFQKLVKAPGSAVWTSQSVTLPSTSTTDTQKYSSYTTRIQALDENNQPMVGEPITISANVRTPVYINYLYYVLDPAGVSIPTDVLGSITVVQWITGLTGAKLLVTDGSGQATAVNPTDAPMAKIAQLNTVGSLQAATIIEDNGSTSPLVSTSASSTAALPAVAAANGQLGSVYSTLSPSSAVSIPAARPTVAAGLDAIDALWVDAGDLFRWLESGVDAVIQIVEDAGSQTWNFIANIAGQVYAAVLDVSEKVVAAAVAVFSMIETAVDDLIRYLQFVFDFPDILITHRVMKNVFAQWVAFTIDGVSSLGPQLSAAFAALQQNIGQWADIPPFNQTPGGTTAANPPLPGQNSAPAQLGIHHYQGGAPAATSRFSPPAVDPSIFQDLINLLDSEEATFSAAATAIQTDIIDQFNSLSIAQIIQKFVAIAADTLLQAAEDILLAVCNVLSQLTQNLSDVLSATIDIPVLSWLYQELTNDNLTFLDLFCFIAAIPATIVYKIAYNAPPFPAGDPFTDGLLDAASFDEVQRQFYSTPTASMAKAAGRGGSSGAEDDSPLLDAERLQVFGVIAGFFAFGGAIGAVIVFCLQRAPADRVPITRVVLACMAAVTNAAYLAPNIVTAINAATHPWWQNMNVALTGCSLMKGLVNIKLACPVSSVGRDRSSLVESVLNLIWFIPVIANLAANAANPYPSLVVESIGNWAFNAGGVLDFPITNIEPAVNPTLWLAACVTQYGLMVTYGGMMVATGWINNSSS